MSESDGGAEAPRHLQAELARALQGLGLADGKSRDGPDSAASVGTGVLGAAQVPGLLAPGAELDRFVILRRIGGGGQGDVYAAYDPRLDRRVALKLIRLSAGAGNNVQNARLLREAHALARLEHPNVVRVHDTGSHGTAAFLVMEFKDSTTLTQWLAAGLRRWQDIVEKFYAAGRGLRAAHERGIIHRDVKADNIFVDDHVGAVLGDFGLALGFGEDAATHGPNQIHAEPRRTALLLQPITGRDQFPGTEGYIAPEAMRGRATVLSDQYSFCVALFHALFGVMPRPDESRWPLRPRDRPPRRLVKALHRGLARDPKARFADMGALLATLAVQSGRRAVILGLAGLGALVLGASFAMMGAPDRCVDTARAELQRVWNPERRAALEAGFERILLPFTARTRRSFLQFAESYSTQWTEARTATCASPSAAVEACLQRQLSRFDRLLTNYVRPDQNSVVYALDAADRLDMPSACRAVSADVRNDVPEAVRWRLDDAEFRIANGDFDAARTVIADLQGLATAHPGARPRLAYLAGWLAAAAEPDRRSDALLEQAMHAAAMALDADTYSRAAIFRLNSLVHDIGDPVEAATVERSIENVAAWWASDAPVKQRFEADLAEARGGRLDLAGDLAAAILEHRRSLALRRNREGDDHPRLAKAHHNLAVTLADGGEEHWAEAREHHLEAYRIYREQLGDEHPRTLEAAFGLAHFECEDLASAARGDPSAPPDCLGDLEAAVTSYVAARSLDPRGTRRRALTLANMAITVGCHSCAEDALRVAETAVADLHDVDVREQSDLFAVRGRLTYERGEFYEARVAFMAGLDLLEGAGRRGAIYFELLGNVATAAVAERRGELAAALVLQRRDVIAGATCDERLAYADVIRGLVEMFAGAPDRNLEDLQAVAAMARRECG